MPYKPSSPCHHPGCPKLAKDGSSYCELHKKQNDKAYNDARGTPSERGYDLTWAKVRDIYKANHPLCEPCLIKQRVVPAEIVHHIKPVLGYPELRLDLRNLMSVCTACHNRIHFRGNA